jgi:hypothetical protein
MIPSRRNAALPPLPHPRPIALTANRLRHSPQAVTMNLFLVTEETALLGLDRHVCELQLVPAPLAPLLVSPPPRRGTRTRRMYPYFHAICIPIP